MILSGKPIADEVQNELRRRMERLPRPPSLTVILVGFHAPSHTYVNAKKIACQKMGIAAEVLNFPEDVSEESILGTIKDLNLNPKIDGILVQFPLPKHLNTMKIVEAVDPRKDVDGFHPENVGKLLLGREDGFVPCTPLGIQKLLEKSDIQIVSSHVVIVGRSQVVGKPLAALLIQNRPQANATVTVVHSQTIHLEKLTRLADILVVATGHRDTIRADMVKEGAVVVDVGINRIVDPSSPRGYRIVGDVDFKAILPKCRAITPVPGGVGPMTVAMLLHNTVLSAERRLALNKS